MDILKRIDYFCKLKGWSYFELAKRAGLSSNTAYNWKNKKSTPSMRIVYKICEAVEITIEQFFCGFNEDLAEDERNLLNLWVGLSELEKKTIFDLISTFTLLKNK